MFTQCPQCDTVFRLGVGDLRRAQGRVRCGECAHVFNALDYLQEDSPEVAPQPPPQPQPPWLTNSARNPPRDIESDPDASLYAAEIATHERLHESSRAAATDSEHEQQDRTGQAADTAVAWDTPDHAGPAVATDTAQKYQDSDASSFAALSDDTGSHGFGFDDATGHADRPPAGEAADAPPPEWHETAEYARTADADNDAAASNDSPTDTDAVPPRGWHESDAQAGLADPDADSHSAASRDSSAGAGPEHPRWWQESDEPARLDASGTESTSAASDVSLVNTSSDDASSSSDRPVFAAASDAGADHDFAGIDDAFGDSELPDLDIDFEDDDDEPGHGILVVDDDPSPRRRRSESGTAAANLGNAGADVQPWQDNAATTEDSEDDRFDPDIWERIPGIGALVDRPMPLPDPADWSPEAEEEPRFTLGDDVDRRLATEDDALPLGDGALEFNVPEDKWDNFFGPVSRGPVAGWRPSALDGAAGDETAATDEPVYNPDSAEPDEADPFAHFDAGDTLPPTRVDAAYRERFWQAEDDRRDIDADDDDDPDDGDDDEIYRVGETGQDDDNAQDSRARDLDDADAYSGTAAAAGGYRDAGPEDDPDLSGDDSAAMAAARDEGWDEDKDEVEGDSTSPDEVIHSSESTEVIPPWRDGSRAEPAAGGRRMALYSVGIVVMLLGLAAQLVHYNRDELAVHPQYGDDLRFIYSLLPFDADLLPRWPLADYEVRSAEAVTGESGADVLDVRAQLVTTGDQPVGLPLLRVVMLDRWSAPVATRDFRPAEYLLDGPPADGMLQPGQTLTAHLRLIDPGRNAAGFELEICLPRRYTGLECNNQPFR